MCRHFALRASFTLTASASPPLWAFNNILLVAAGTDNRILAVFTQCAGCYVTSLHFPLCAAKAAQPAREVVPALQLSFRELIEMMAERGLSMAHTTIMRWVHR